MKKKMVYENASENISHAIIDSKIIEDFLPCPEELVKKKESVSLFKKKAKEAGIPYQKMIKNLLDRYTEKFSG